MARRRVTKPVDPVTQYALDVVEDKIITGRLVRLACERHLRDLDTGWQRGLKWDPDAAQHTIDFFQFLKHYKGEWAGQTVRLEPWQQFRIGSVFGWKRADGTRRFRTAYHEVARKNGKMLSLDTPIPTPEGWKTIGEIETGDYVFAPDGQPCKVTVTFPVDPNPKSYKMTFSNGEAIKACADHLWVTTAHVDTVGSIANGQRRRIKRWKGPRIYKHRGYVYVRLWGDLKYVGPISDPNVLDRAQQLMEQDLQHNPIGVDTLTRARTTQEIYESQRYGKRQDVNHSIELPMPLRLPERNLLIDPYVLGVWLGDGTSNTSNITAGMKDADEIADLIRKAGETVEVTKHGGSFTLHVGKLYGRQRDTCRRGHSYPDWDGVRCKACERMVRHARRNGLPIPPYTVNGLETRLRELGLLNNKHIPREYLRASYLQRLSLLQGLMDSDGTINSNGTVLEFTTINKSLAQGISELLSTLAIKHSARESQATLHGNVVGPKWRIQFNAFSDENPVFRLRRKLSRMRAATDCNIAPRSKTVQITSVEPCDPVPMRCIAVDHPSHQFLCGRSMIPTHNSLEAGALGLYMLDADGEPGAEVYSAATKKDQARIVWNDAARMVRKSRPLSNRIQVYPGKGNMNIEDTASKFEPLGADEDTLDGLNIHCAIIDELHAHKTRAVWDVLETATGSRRQPLIWAITTAGFDQTGICYENRGYSIDVLEGRVDDDSWFAYIATLDEDDDWEDESVWIKANPNVGVSVKLDDLRRLALKAKTTPAAVNNFLTKRMNVWTQQSTRWIDLDLWDENGTDIISEEKLAGRRCFGGLDLSSVSDLTAWVMIFPRDDDPETVDVLPRFWCPEKRLTDDSNRYRDQYKAWARQGLLKPTPGDAVDYAFVKKQIIEDATRFQLVDLNVDRLFQAHQLATELMDEGLIVVGMGQGFLSMAAPMQELERRLLARKIRHGGNPVLRWMAGNVAVKQDPAGNLKPDKAQSQGKIDGIVALVMALDRAMRHIKPQKSVYEERGILTL